MSNHDHEHEHEDTIFLVDEETGEEMEFEIIVTLEHEGTEYALLKKAEDDSDDMFAFRIEEDEEGEVLMPVEDDAELDLIQKIYDELSWED
ncbi:DUF1292 domain-containing protein [Alkalibacter rhizosphaerae]|uniref:DUF1292 domain-containing protein n=1 Tax=Alkalibacter rhizosphaerae TaxID=2815577 RepID=A0A975AHP4_9FIRM|nr:DUF1292 domain-containing protein [Alkalibacter rhizosphaerae]QSX08662.1 DUF1292 domain-containing protein [Alkalibacter rhizosphaerae]